MQKLEHFLKVARDRFRLAEEAERENREEARKDLAYLAGDQWSEADKQERRENNRPFLTFNKLPTFVSQVVNEARQNKPAIRVSPVDSGPDKDMARVMQGHVRHIEYDSDADVARETAVEYSVSCGFGAFRILTDYVSDESFDLEAKFERIEDPFTVYFDPHARRADRADMSWCFVRKRLSKDAFLELWPDCETATTNFFEGSDTDPEWMNESGVTVAEYWYIETEKRRFVACSNGAKGYLDELFPGGKLPEGVSITKERTVMTRRVRCAKINGREILEDAETLGSDWPGQWIPIIPVFGKELVVDGVRKLFSLIRFQRDPQALFNYYKTAMAETAGQTPRAPYIGVAGQFKGFERQWKTANVSPRGYLEYNRVDVNGAPAPAPQRQQFEPPIQALSIGAMQASDDMKACAGMFDAALGAASNEKSGIAIERRQKESDVANFHFLDNLARAQRHAGRILVDLIPRITDTEREIRILGDDFKQSVIRANAAYVDETGKQRLYDYSVGKYDVTVETGPSYTTQRRESFDMLTQMASASPKILDLGGDIIFRASDIPGADKLADRWKKTLPPELQEDEDEKDPNAQPPLPPQVQALIQQHETLLEQVHNLSGLVEGKQLELASRERIAAMQVKADLIKTFATIDHKEAIQLLNADLSDLDRRNALDEAARDREHAATEGALDRDATPALPAAPPASNLPKAA
jgi:Phage P22-like portal protein